MRRFLIFCGIAAFAVLYLLTFSTDSQSRFARNTHWPPQPLMLQNLIPHIRPSCAVS